MIKSQTSKENNEYLGFPRISIVMPVFNAVQYISAAIKSVLAQNYPNLELIVIDGGSNDGTVSAIEQYSNQITYWVSEPDEGQTNALNKGFSHASGELCAWLNADEEYLPDTLNKVAKIYAADKSVDLIFGGRILLDLTCHPSRETIQLLPAIAPFNLTMYTGRILFTDATFWSKSLHEMTGVLDEINYSRYAMDVDWLLRISGNSKKFARIDEPLSVFKLHGKNITTEGDSLGKRFNERIRRDYAESHNISKIKIFLGWVFYSTLLRYFERGLKGLLVPPKLSTMAYLFSDSHKK
jgi:glycosyltransferase involved in cell wall biosynthesis